MLECIERVVSLFDFIGDKNTVEYGRMYEEAFTREAPLNFENSVLIHLNKHSLTNYMEVRNFFKKKGERSVTNQVFSKSRDKLDPNVFKILKDYHLNDFYKSDEVKTIKNHLILTGDGSKFIFPYKYPMIPIFRGIENKFHEITSITANSTIIYDCLNKFVLDLELDSYKTSEKDLINRNMDNLWKLSYLESMEKILTFDRGFPSIEFFIKLMEKDEKFLMKLKKISYKKEKSEMKTNDEFIDIDTTKSRVNNIKNQEIKEKLLKIGKVNLRVTKIVLDSGKVKHLISNLNVENFSFNDLNELYQLRWRIEVSFDVLKNSLDIENISGYKEIAVKQDFLSQMVAYNIITDIENTAQRIFDKREEKKRK
jgi:IS4 transposase